MLGDHSAARRRRPSHGAGRAGARAALGYCHVPGADQRVSEYAQRRLDTVVRLIKAGDFTACPDLLAAARPECRRTGTVLSTRDDVDAAALPAARLATRKT